MIRRRLLIRWALGFTLAAVLGVAALWGRRVSEGHAWHEQPAPLPEGYVDDARCAACHADYANRCARTGMGRSWSRWKSAPAIEARPPQTATCAAPGFSYQALLGGGTQVQREFRVDGDGEWTTQTRQADYVLGSGGHGRAYVHADKGYLTILPLGWYSEKGVWDLNPGYQFNNQRFSRRVGPRCISCHTAMVGYRPASGFAYQQPLPEGIGCQRCHGPGAAHCALYSQPMPARSPDDASTAIVNPAKLRAALQQDVCLQCHLTGDVAVAQPGYDAWGFRPGMALRTVRSDFFVARQENPFKSVGHGPRSMASACYKKSGGQMTCIVCHDPHEPHTERRSEFHNQRCLDCHARQSCNRPRPPKESARQGDCVACHMPKRPSGDIVHAFATDHWIQRPGQKLGVPAQGPVDPDGLTPFWPDTDDSQRGLGLVRYYADRGRPDKVEQGLRLLEQALSRRPDVADWYEGIGFGYFKLGRWDQAEPALRRALAIDAQSVEARQFLGLTLIQRRQPLEASDVLAEAVRRFPWCADNDTALAQLYLELGQHERLVAMEAQYFRHHPDDAVRLEMVARALTRLHRPEDQIRAVLERAIAADGSRAAPYLQRAALAAQQENVAAVEQDLRAALRAEPDAPEAGIAWARFLASQGKYLAARAQIQHVAAAHPDYAPAQALNRQFNGLKP